MNQKFLSNQEVFNSVQPATIKVEPDFKSTILYSNQFASENPISPTGELQQILDSQIGSAGTNVLVQLKQKMLALAGGPWYIDMVNGIIHIHNRRYTTKPSSYYAYQSENGEVLSANFRLVDVYKNQGSMRSFVNNLTKGLQNFVGALTNNINDRLGLIDSNIKEQSLVNSYFKEGNQTLQATVKQNGVHQPDKTRVDNSIVKAEAEAQRKYGVSAEAQVARFAGKHMTESQKRQLKRSRIDEVSKNYDIPSTVRLLRAKYKDVDIAWKEYESVSKNPLASNKEREAARQFALSVAKKHDVLIGRTRKYDDGKEFKIQTTIYVYRHIGGQTYAQVADSGTDFNRQIQVEVNKKIKYFTALHARDGWRYTRYVKGAMGKPVQHKPKGLELFKAGVDYKYPVTIYLYFTGYRGTDIYMDGSRVLAGLPRIQPPTTNTAPIAPINVGNFLNNAHNNFGKQKKEVRLEGTLLVIGNPHLETGQQLHLSNVSKAYSGLWYIAKVVHKLEPSSGYTSECTIMRQMPEKRSEGEAEYTTVENTDNKPKGEANKVTGTSPSKHPKPTSNKAGTTKPVSKGNPSSGDTKTTTVMFNAFEKTFMATQVKALSTREDVVSVTSRTATDIAVTKAVTGKSPVKVNPKTGAITIDRKAIDVAKIKAQGDPNIHKKVQQTGSIKATTDRVLTRWVRSRGHSK